MCSDTNFIIEAAPIVASIIAIFVAIFIPIRIADKQNKVALFEKRLALYSEIHLLLELAEYLKPLNKSPNVRNGKSYIPNYRNLVLNSTYSFFRNRLLIRQEPQNRLFYKNFNKIDDFLEVTPFLFNEHKLIEPIQFLFPKVDTSELLAGYNYISFIFNSMRAEKIFENLNNAPTKNNEEDELDYNTYFPLIESFLKSCEIFKQNELPKMHEALKLTKMD